MSTRRGSSAPAGVECTCAAPAQELMAVPSTAWMMRGDGSFSDEWHRFYSEQVVSRPGSRNVLKEIEQQAEAYERDWKERLPFDAQGFDDVDTSGIPGQLRVAAHLVGLVGAVVACRSVHLTRAFIHAVNSDDFESAPLLIRAVLEQAALGFHAVKRIRKGLLAFRANMADGVVPFEEAVLSALFGAKMNFGAVVKETQERIASQEDFDYTMTEMEVIKTLIETGRFEEKTSAPEDSMFLARSVAEMVDVLAEESLQEGAPPKALRRVWEYLSQYCHPSVFSWSFYLEEVWSGSESEEEDLVSKRRMALDRFIQPMWEWVVTLPAHASLKLDELRTEIEEEASAVEGKP